MLKLIFPLVVVIAFISGWLIFAGLRFYSSYILIPKMREKGIIDGHEAFWYFSAMTPIPALRDYLENNTDIEFEKIYKQLHFLSKFSVALIGGSLALLIIGNIIESQLSR